MTIRGTLRSGNYFEYELFGRTYWVQGELYFNKAMQRYEHQHGKVLIWWN